MTRADPAELLERELAYYRQEVNDLGSRLLRLQEDQSRTAREARRSRTVARLIRQAYQLADRDLPVERIGPELLTVIADIAICDRAALLARTGEPGCFRVEHAIGMEAAGELRIGPPPAFLYTASGVEASAVAGPLAELLGVPYLLWACDAVTGRALLLGNKLESHVHRAFEPGDRELVQGALAVYADVLARRRAETELLQAKTAAELANETRARSLATLTHELRTPLNAIIGFSELLLEQGTRAPSENHQREFAGQILAAGRSLLLLVNDILDYSAVSHAAPRLRFEWVPAAPMLQAACRTFLAATGEDLAVICDGMPPGLELHVDHDRCRQILTNLIGNAVKFTPSGRITVSAELRAGGTAAIIVRDTGIGMLREDIPRALEPFVQLDSALRRRYHGTGLGLPIARQLAAAHGGALAIDSEPGVGTTVTVTLPSGSARLETSAPDTAILDAADPPAREPSHENSAPAPGTASTYRHD